MLRELVSKLLSQFEPVWPIQSRWSAQDFADLGHLVLFRLAREQGPHREELSHDAAHSEDVDRGVVVRVAKEDFGRSVPPRAHIVSEGRPCVDLFRKTAESNEQC